MDYTAAMKGYLMEKGVDTELPVTRDEYLDMLDWDKERMKKLGNGN